MEAGVKYLDGSGYELSYLIARKKLDYFYLKFDFFGASSYQKLNVKVKHINTEDDYTFSNFNRKNLTFYSDWYNKNYENNFGNIERSEKHWIFLEKNKADETRFFRSSLQGQPSGYIIKNEEGIIECAFSPYSDLSVIRNAVLSKENTRKRIIIRIPHHHFIVDCFRNDDVHFISRRCIYGGHMIRWSEKVIDIPLELSIGINSFQKSNPFLNIGLLDEI